MDFIPTKRANRYLWLKNLSDNVVAEAVKMGAPAPDATAAKAKADDIIAKMDATDAAVAAVDGARELLCGAPHNNSYVESSVMWS